MGTPVATLRVLGSSEVGKKRLDDPSLDGVPGTRVPCEDIGVFALRPSKGEGVARECTAAAAPTSRLIWMALGADFDPLAKTWLSEAQVEV